MYKKIIGDYGEVTAYNILKNKGYEILEKKYYTPFGELDLIAKENTIFIFFEIKTRTNNNYGSGLFSITNSKKKHIIKAAMYYLITNAIKNHSCRFDVLLLNLNHLGKIKSYELVKNAFQVEGGNYY